MSKVEMSEPAQNVLTQDSFDTLFRLTVVKPLLNAIPRSVTPNFITFLNIPVRSTVLLLSYLQSQQFFSTSCAVIALFTISILFLLNEVIDDLDGMQARKTDQYSKFGEIFDHVLDAYGVPILGVAVPLALQLSPLSVVAGLWGPTLIYNLQLILYRRTGTFVEPLVSGARSACVGSISVVVIGILNIILGRHSTFMSIVSMFAEIALLVGCFQNISFYILRIWQDHVENKENRDSLISECGHFLLTCITYSSLFLSQYNFYLLSSLSLTHPLVANELIITPLSLTSITTGYSSIVNGQEVQNIVLNKPKSSFVKHLSLGLVITLLCAFLFNHLNYIGCSIHYAQNTAGVLMIVCQGLSLVRCFNRGQ